jgi:nucleoside-diphosphate-sugar epimerase
MSKVLVTGGAGYIGSILTETLLQDGHEVIVVDNFMYRQNSLLNVVNSKRLRIEVGDVRNLNLMSSLL